MLLMAVAFYSNMCGDMNISRTLKINSKNWPNSSIETYSLFEGEDIVTNSIRHAFQIGMQYLLITLYYNVSFLELLAQQEVVLVIQVL